MKLALWTYEGPPHVGAMRVATAMEGLHYVLHAPQGDTYADLLFTMIERRAARPPVSYTTFKAEDLGADTADLFTRTAREAVARFRPEAVIVGASCTAELLQDDPGGLAASLDLQVPVIPLELPSYSRKESWGAAETFHRLVRALAEPRRRPSGGPPVANLLGATALGFRHRDDVTEIAGLLRRLGIEIGVTAPLGARPKDLARLPDADLNVVLYPETAELAARHLERAHGQPYTRTVPIGTGATRDFVREVAALAGVDPAPGLEDPRLRQPWWSASVDSTYLTGKRVFVFGDASHAIAAARVAALEMGFEIAGLGCYNREFARDLRAAADRYGVPALVTDDYLEVEAAIAEAEPELVLGTQMERMIAKRLGIPCAVISAPVHVQDFPARYAPQMGYEGANVLFDTWVHPLVMGLEEHLLAMFREDFEFHDGAGPSHLEGRVPRHAGENEVAAGAAAGPGRPEPAPGEGGSTPPETGLEAAVGTAVGLGAAVLEAPTDHVPAAATADPLWQAEAERELRKIPFFVRGKARRNTERFAAERGLATITVETLYDAKAHFAR